MHLKVKPEQEISHYKIVEKLGVGGMGIVYKAQDLKLDRFVALKFLPPQVGLDEDEKERFIQEAKTTSALDHPNICTIYEIDETEEGQVFISMACYEGETLRQKISRGLLSVQEAIQISIQILEGLSKAHDNGIIHRDIKPDNIILTIDGVVKILDFGIAKLKNTKQITRPGNILGTPRYMSPEQASGQDIDHRVDIWAMGVMLYEMLTCQLPFKGDNDLTMMYAIINEQPQPLSAIRSNISAGLQGVVEKALAKDPGDRYHQAMEMAQDLRLLEGGKEIPEKTRIDLSPVPQTPSIVVLPLNDISPEKDQEYFCDGLTEEIINTLSRVEGLRVVARNSAFRFKKEQEDFAGIGRQLNVQTILEGSVQKSGNKLRIAIRLVSVADGVLLWAEKFDRQMDDIFAIQDEISQAVVGALKIKLIGVDEAHLMKRYTDNVEAYNTYLKGRFYWNKRTVEFLNKSIDHYNHAIKIDSNYALAYAGLADTYTTLGFYGAYPTTEVFPKAKSAAEKALQLDDMLAEAHISLGCISSVYDWDWAKAEQEFRRGIELNPAYPTAHHWYAINFLVPAGRFREAAEEIEQALHLDPVSLVINTTVGLTHYFSRNFDKAIEVYLKTLEMDPNYAVTNMFLGQAYVQKGLYEKAIEHFKIALKFYGDSTNMLAMFGNANALAGHPDVAANVLENLLDSSKKAHVSAYDLATLYAGLGDAASAINSLERAYEERAYLLVYLKVDPVLDKLRGFPEFAVLLQNIFGNM